MARFRRPLALLFHVLCTATVAAAPPVALSRFALVVGCNLPGGGRGELRYAVRDAASFATVMTELGGVDPEHLVYLSNPRREELTVALKHLAALVEQGRTGEAREEVLFYYSGHADAKGLLLGNEVLEYTELRATLESIRADVHVAVMDACASGAMTRTKGGTRKPAFLFDASTVMEGHAYLTSSSHDEAAQESDQIKGSFFTHYLISGLRGGADANVDGRVTLNEAYQFAFSETLKRTERTYAGPQHPSYDITLKGSGDLVFTDLRASSAGLKLDAAIEGNLFVRDAEGDLLVEIRKRAGKPMELGLQPGTYTVTLERPASRLATTVHLKQGEFTALDDRRMKAVTTEATVSRGGRRLSPRDLDALANHCEAMAEAEEDRIERAVEDEEERVEREREWQEDSIEGEHDGAVQRDSLWGPGPRPSQSAFYGPPTGRPGARYDTTIFSFDIVPRTRTLPDGTRGSNDMHNVSLNFIMGRYAVIHGIGIGLIGQWADDYVWGVQASLIGNFCGGPVHGGQFSLIGNSAQADSRGIQGSHIYNLVGGSMTGAQFSNVANYAASLRGIQAANVANVCSNNILGVQMSNVVNVARGVVGGQLTNVANANHGHLSGIQAANVANYSRGVYGAQISNVANVSAGDVKGIQLTNVVNVARDVDGAQIACVANAARDVSGVQLSLVANRARAAQGAQMALLVNVAEESHGFLFGILNVVRRDGEVHPGISYDEAGLLTMTLRTGNRNFYGLLSAGGELQGHDDRSRAMTVGVGWGASVPVGRFLVSSDASAHLVSTMSGLVRNAPNQLTRVRASLGFRVFDHLAPFVGVSANLQHNHGDPDGLLRQGLFGSVSFGRHTRSEFWPGVFAGIDF